jgi:hypothetical protein
MRAREREVRERGVRSAQMALGSKQLKGDFIKKLFP